MTPKSTERTNGFDAVRGRISALESERSECVACARALGLAEALISPASFHRFVEGPLAERAPDAYRELVTDLVATLSIWFPRSLYDELPVILPHVMRDNDCRKEMCSEPGHTKKVKGRVGEARDQWSTPSDHGYVRDDNSLIKTLTRSMRIESENPLLSNRKLGNGFVACHIWPMATATDLWLNSFVANLVWLPKPLDLMSDRPGHLAGKLLRQMSALIYRNGAPSRHSICDELWQPLAADRPIEFPSGENFFAVSPRWVKSRRDKITRMTELLAARARGDKSARSSGHSHYDLHAGDLDPVRIAPLAERLGRYSRDLDRHPPRASCP